MVIKHMRIAASFCILVWLAPVHTYAQSVDSCMTAKGKEAVQICQTLLNNGNRSAEIYYQLSSQLYQLGQTSEALSILDNGLSRYSGNTLLSTLRNTLVSDSEEQAALRASAQKNETVMNRGQLKLTCLTKTSTDALRACEAYLAMTNVDGDKVRTRAQKITAALAPVPATAPNPEIATIQEIGKKAPPAIAPKESIQPPVITSVPVDPTVIALRKLIRDIQTGLSSLGFNVGTPDGISGPRTRAAIQEFYSLTQQARRDRLDDQTLVDVQAAVTDLNSANEFLKRSRAAASTQQIDEAIQLLASAERSSTLFEAPIGYRQNLNVQLTQSAQTTTTEATSITSGSTVQPVTTKGIDAAQPTPNQLTEATSNIKALTEKLALRRADGLQKNKAMRDVVNGLFK